MHLVSRLNNRKYTHCSHVSKNAVCNSKNVSQSTCNTNRRTSYYLEQLSFWSFIPSLKHLIQQLLFVCEKVALSNMSPHYVLDVLITIGLHILCMLQVTLHNLQKSYKKFFSWFKNYSSSYTNLVPSMGLMLTIEKNIHDWSDNS